MRQARGAGSDGVRRDFVIVQERLVFPAHRRR